MPQLHYAAKYDNVRGGHWIYPYQDPIDISLSGIAHTSLPGHERFAKNSLLQEEEHRP